MSTETIAIAETNLELLDLCLQGDRDARQELAVRISKIVYGYTNQAAFSLKLHLTREDYQDINQNILIKLFEDNNNKLRTFNRESSLERWIYVIVYNHVLDKRLRDAKEKARRKTISIHEPVGTDPEGGTIEDTLAAEGGDPREILAYRSMVEALRSACRGVLNEEEQTILDLWCSKQYTTNQIAALLGRKPNTISTLIYRAQAKILEYLREKEPDTVL